MKIDVIGSGFAGLSAASFLAKEGHQVVIHEKNTTIGGRARIFREQGFAFDMGPSWYWMPDVMERHFSELGYDIHDFLDLKQLDPAYKMVFGPDNEIVIPSNAQDIYSLFESIEKGSAAQLKKYMKRALYKYNVGVKDLVYKPSLSIMEFMRWDVIKGFFKLNLLKSFDSYVASYFKDPRLRTLMEFPVLFLGAMPRDTPALYSLMNYSAIMQGTFYPMGGMHELAKAMADIAKKLGVDIRVNQRVDQIIKANNRAESLVINGQSVATEAVIASADYHHVDQQLLKKPHYSKKYWDSRVMAPSSLLFYLGIDKKVPKLIHHNLFFDTDFAVHSKEIYTSKSWPSDPLYYVCCPSKTDPSVAPEGHENLFILIPLAPGLDDPEAIREKYYHMIMKRLEDYTGVEDLRSHVIYKKSYCVSDFKNDYNAFRGNAYGLANTLRQTALFKPRMHHKSIENLYFAGQLTTPGPGVPPSIISGEVAAKELIKRIQLNTL